MKMALSRAINAIKKLDYPIPVIIPGHWVNALGVVRSLHLDGLTSIAIDNSPDGLAVNSRYAIGLVSPSPIEQPDQFIDFLVELGKQLPQKGILLATQDDTVRTVSRQLEILEPYYHFTFPHSGILEKASDKVEQYRAAAATGVPIAHTVVLNAHSSLNDWPENAYPVIIKGRAGKGFQYSIHHQAVIVHNFDELTRIVTQNNHFDLILQEYIPGGDDTLYFSAIYTNQQGQCLGAYTGRKLVQSPRNIGIGRIIESLDCPQLVEYHQKICNYLHYFGVSEAEFKLDARDGQYKLIEINCRLWMQNWHATFCGVNFPVIAYRDALRLPPQVHPQPKIGVRWGLALNELTRWPLDIIRKEFTLSIYRYFLPPYVDAVVDWYDPLPGCVMLKTELASYLSLIKTKLS